MNIYIGNLSHDVNEVDLKKTFEDFGPVESTKVITDMYTGRSKGFGFVEMPKSADANSAIAGLDGKELKGRTLKVNKARPRSGARPGVRKRTNPRYYY
jgi:RNA recognition motif-containing protein